MRQFCWALMVVVFAAGCDSTGPDFSRAQEFAIHRAKWSSRNIHNYSFDYAFASVWMNPPKIRVNVVADTVASVQDLSTGTSLPNAGAPTIDSLFAEVGRVLSVEPFRGEPLIQYDPAFGYPVSIDTNNSSPPDAGFTLHVDNFLQVSIAP
jgi:hypothetical protein